MTNGFFFFFFFLKKATALASDRTGGGNDGENIEIIENIDNIDPGLRAWMGDHSRPVVVNFGSMNCMDENVPENAVQAALDLGEDVVFVTGWGAADGKRWDCDRVFVCESAPHEWLLPLARVVVHHGGAGTTARALWSAVPSVVYPVLLFYDQPGWCEELMSFPLKTMNSVFKTRNCVMKTRDFVFKLMDFAGRRCWRTSSSGCAAWRHRVVGAVPGA